MPESTLDHSIPYPSPSDPVRGSTADYLQTDLRDLALGVDAAITAAVGTRAPLSHTHTQAQVSGLSAALSSAGETAQWGSVSGKPSAYPPSAHSHAVSDVDGLQGALDDALGPAITPVAEGIYSTTQSTEAAPGIHESTTLHQHQPGSGITDTDLGAALTAYIDAMEVP